MSDRLSLAIVCHARLGGSGVIAADIAVGLARRGHRVRVIATARPARTLPGHENLIFEQVSTSNYPLFDHPPYTLDVAAKIVEVARAHDLDLVHLHYAIPHAASALLARQTLGDRAPRFVTTLHGTDVTVVGGDPGYREVTRMTVVAADGVTAPSEFLRREAVRLLALPPEVDVEVIPNFVDTGAFAPPQRRDRRRLGELLAMDGTAPAGPFLFHVSNFRPVKRTPELMDILARVRARVPAHLVLVGDGPERENAQRRAAELGLYRHVTFLGERTDFAELLGHADAFVLPSESESFGVAALEALSCGVPVFGYRVGGLPEVVADGCGTLVESFDVDALAGAIVAMLGDDAGRERARRAARARAVDCFEREQLLDRYESLYRRLTVGRPAAPRRGAGGGPV